MKKSFFILGFLISLLISCPPPTPEPGPDEGGSGSGSETAKEFTVSFDANGGTGTIAPMKVKAGTEITLPDGTAFSRKYYTFNYWTISGTDFYEAGSKYTVKADTVFSAAWRHNQVSITYDSNDDTVSDTEQWVNAGSDLILPGNLFDSSPSGKHFYGWTTSATATEDDILAPGSAFPVDETELTFYAFWGSESVTEYTVTFFGTEMEAITFNRYTEEIRLPLYTGEPGMICKGWDTDSAAETVVYEDGGTIPKTALTGDIVLYPILEDIRVALTWEKNGAVSPYDSTVFPNQAAPGDFLFMAYAVTKDSGDGKVWILESVTAETVSGQTVSTRKEMMDGIAEVWYISVPAEATVITLNWKEKTDVTVTSLTVEENYEYTEGDPAIDFWFIYKADFDPAKGNLKITKDGQEVEILSYLYEFYTAEEKVGDCELSPEQGAGQYLLQIIVNGNVLKEASFNVTLTDSSDPTTPQTHTVTFNAGGGTGTVDPMTAEAGTVITLPSADGLSRQYYTFTAWKTGGKQYNPGDQFTVSADTVFTAVWTRNTITVTYKANHESVTPSTHTETVDAGGFFRLSENPFSNSPDGQIFYGWATTAATATETNILAPGSTFPVEETDLTFYAYWRTESVKEYKVTFSGTEMEPITFNEYTEEIRLPLYTGEPGMICKGWDTDSAAETVVYEDGGTIPKTALTGDIVLYPILEDIRVALTWEKNGAVSPYDSTVFPNQAAPGDFLFMAYAVTKDSGDGKVWILESVTAETVSGQTVSTRKEMMDGIAEVWYISVPAEATVITLNWKEKTDVTVTSLTVEENYEYTEGDPAIDFWFIYKADFDPAKGNLKITKDGQEVEILSYLYEFYTAEEKVGDCELSPEQGAGQYLLQIIVNGNVLKEASFNVTLTDSSDPTTPQTHTVTFNAGGGTGTVDPMTAEAGTVITLPSADGLSRQYYTFTAWKTGGKQYNPGDQFTVSADTVFTAVWTRNTITVTYEAGNASVTPATHTETVDAGGFFRLPENPFDNSPDGQILYGWALTQTPQESEIFKPNTEYTAGEADITFYAVWKSSSEVVSLTWNKNGAEILSPYLEESALFPATLTSGTTFKFPAYAVTKKPATGGNPFLLTGLTVETADGTTVAVSEQTNSESGLSEWSFTTGSENLNITLNWQEVTDPSVIISQILPTYNPGAMNVAMTYLSCNFNPYPEMLSLYEYKSEKDEYELVAADCRFSDSVNGEYVFEINWSETITGREHYYKVNATTGSTSKEYRFFLEPPKISLTYIKNGAEVPPAYQEDAFPVAVYQGTVMLEEMHYFKNDGDAPYILTGINVTETVSGNPVNVTKSDGDYCPCWSFQAGTEALTVELLWEKQTIANDTFDVQYVFCEKNYIEVAVLTDIALSPGMITVTDGNDNPFTPFQKFTTCAQIQNGIRSYSCFLDFSTNIPAGTYNVIVTVSGQTIHTETVTVSEPQP